MMRDVPGVIESQKTWSAYAEALMNKGNLAGWLPLHGGESTHCSRSRARGRQLALPGTERGQKRMMKVLPHLVTCR